MFDTLAKGFKQARNRLAGLTELTEANVETALREVRLSLLEADVELGVVKTFLARVKEKAIGEVVRVKATGAGGQTMKVSAGDQFTKIAYDELVAFMSAPEGDEPLKFAAPGDGRPTGIMMVGLQGSGKTTTSAKLARYLKDDLKKKPLLVAADMQRPAAVEQLQVLGKQVGIPVFNVPGDTPLEICKKAVAEARAQGQRRHRLRHRRPSRHRRGAHERARRHQGGGQAGERLPRRRRHDRSGRGQGLQGLPRQARSHRRRPHQARWRRSRRRGAQRARGHRRARSASSASAKGPTSSSRSAPRAWRAASSAWATSSA